MQLDSMIIVATGIIIITVIIGAILYLRSIGKVGTKKVVLLLRPRDKRGIVIPVVKETDRILECKKVSGVTHRYLKNGPGWTFPDKTIFIAEEGIAYTATLVKGNPINVSLLTALKSLFGEDEYKKIPPKLKDIIEHHQWGVVVNIQGKPEDAKLPSLSPEAVNDTRYEALLNFLVKTLKAKAKFDWTMLLLGIFAGFAVTYLAVNMHWIRAA